MEKCFKKIFNIRDIKTYLKQKRVVTICGLDITFDLNKFNRFFIKKYQNKTLKRIQEKVKTKKLKVVFLSSEIQKWNANSLYWTMAKSDLFEPLVLIYPLFRVHDGFCKGSPTLEDQYNFYANQGINVEYLYENNNYLKLEDFKPDIVFYQQHWDLPAIYAPEYVAKFALTCYFTYGMEILESRHDYLKDFHKLLYKFFVDNDYNIQRYESYKKGNSKNCVAIGHPKLDEYLKPVSSNADKYWKSPDKFRIIYAPHHSVEAKSILRFATFKKNGKFIQELAEKHPETTWIFKPHPRFPVALEKDNVMTKSEIDEYYDKWAQIGNIYDKGDYFDIFKSSDLLITDCCAFLVEYLPSGKPTIRMVNPDSIKLNKYGESIVEHCYQTYDNQDLEKMFDMLVREKNDYKAEKRHDFSQNLLNYNKSCATKICEYLESFILK